MNAALVGLFPMAIASLSTQVKQNFDYRSTNWVDNVSSVSKEPIDIVPSERSHEKLKFLLQYFGYESFWLQILQIHRSKAQQTAWIRVFSEKLRFSTVGHSDCLPSNTHLFHVHTRTLTHASAKAVFSVRLCQHLPIYLSDCLSMLSPMCIWKRNLSRSRTHTHKDTRDSASHLTSTYLSICAMLSMCCFTLEPDAKKIILVCLLCSVSSFR